MFHCSSFLLSSLYGGSPHKVCIQPVVGPDGKKKEPESNVLFASLENMQYAVTIDVLHTVFFSLLLFH